MVLNSCPLTKQARDLRQSWRRGRDWISIWQVPPFVKQNDKKSAGMDVVHCRRFFAAELSTSAAAGRSNYTSLKTLVAKNHSNTIAYMTEKYQMTPPGNGILTAPSGTDDICPSKAAVM